jgi:hypothetical protein
MEHIQNNILTFYQTEHRSIKIRSGGTPSGDLFYVHIPSGCRGRATGATCLLEPSSRVHMANRNENHTKSGSGIEPQRSLAAPRLLDVRIPRQSHKAVLLSNIKVFTNENPPIKTQYIQCIVLLIMYS